MSLPLQLPWDQAQTKWKSQLDPVLANALLNGQTLVSITLTTSTPRVIYHSLGQVPNGWIITDQQASSNVWRTAWSNTSITLEASATTTVNIWIY